MDTTAPIRINENPAERCITRRGNELQNCENFYQR